MWMYVFSEFWGIHFHETYVKQLLLFLHNPTHDATAEKNKNVKKMSAILVGVNNFRATLLEWRQPNTSPVDPLSLTSIICGSGKTERWDSTNYFKWLLIERIAMMYSDGLFFSLCWNWWMLKLQLLILKKFSDAFAISTFHPNELVMKTEKVLRHLLFWAPVITFQVFLDLDSIWGTLNRRTWFGKALFIYFIHMVLWPQFHSGLWQAVVPSLTCDIIFMFF